MCYPSFLAVISLPVLKTWRDLASVKPPGDVCTPAGVAKMLIKDTDKLSSKDLREGRCHPVVLLFQWL